MVEGTRAVVVATMYDIDDHLSGYGPSEGSAIRAGASEAGSSAGHPKAKPNRAKKQVEFEMALEHVFTFGTHLGRHDVTQNIRDRNVCDECGSHERALRMCDGCFPVAVGQAFPIGAIGRQHA